MFWYFFEIKIQNQQYLYLLFFVSEHFHSISEECSTSTKKAVVETQYIWKEALGPPENLKHFLFPLHFFSSSAILFILWRFHRITTGTLNHRTKSSRYTLHIGSVPTDLKNPYRPMSAHLSLTSPSQPVNH